MSLARRVASIERRVAAHIPADDIPDGDDPVAWAEAVAGYPLDKWQADFMRSDAKRGCLLCSRQVGKSSTVALKAAHIVMGGGKVVATAPTLRQSGLLYRQMLDHIRASGATTIRETQTEVELANGGIGVSLPGDRPSQIRGVTLRHEAGSALLIDEAAYVREGLWPVISPMMAAAPDARMLMLSTPNGPGNEFHRIWEEGGEDWQRVRVTAAECSRISDKFLAEERARLGDLIYRQEYLCEFVQAYGSFFNADMISDLFEEAGAPDIEEMFGT